jgi:hypothetical protein
VARVMQVKELYIIFVEACILASRAMYILRELH